MERAVLVDGVRSAFAKGQRGALTATRLDEAAAQIVRALLERNPQVPIRDIRDVALGAVPGRVRELMPGIGAKHVAHLVGLPHEVAGFDIYRACGSSMEAIHRIAQGIMVGQYDCALAVGVERFDPHGADVEGAGSRVTEFNPKRLTQTQIQRDPAPDHDEVFGPAFPDAVLDSPAWTSMAQTAQNVAEACQVTRERMDAFAVESHQRAIVAYAAGSFRSEVVPLEVERPVFDETGRWVSEERGVAMIFDRDECIRPGTSVEVLAQLPPVRGLTSPTGVDLRVTAGNSCPTNDGVSAALVMSERRALELGIEPLARFIGFGVAGVKPQLMGLGPVPATLQALQHAGISMADIGRVELNEAFAAQVLPCIAMLGMEPEMVNVNGGAIALGHPIAATGARLVFTLAHEMRRSGTKYGLATQCLGMGAGISTILERVN